VRREGKGKRREGRVREGKEKRGTQHRHRSSVKYGGKTLLPENICMKN